jgi:hypothetical protein
VSSPVNPRTTIAKRVEISEDSIVVKLDDGRTIAAPLGWYPRLATATVAERNNWRFIGGGNGIHWPDIDENVSIKNCWRAIRRRRVKRRLRSCWRSEQKLERN